MERSVVSFRRETAHGRFAGSADSRPALPAVADALEGPSDRSLAFPGRTGDKEAAPGIGHDTEELKGGIREEKIGKSSPDGIVIDRSFSWLLTMVV